MAKTRAARRRARKRGSPNNSNGAVSTQYRSVSVTGGAISKTTVLYLGSKCFGALSMALSGFAEWRLVRATFWWEPMVNVGSDKGAVLISAYPTDDMKPPTDIDTLLRAGGKLRPASSRHSTSVQGVDEWKTTRDPNGGLIVYLSKESTEAVGRISGTIEVRTRGVGAL
jgi:hypothetical protein